jgi:hypothetical protein
MLTGGEVCWPDIRSDSKTFLKIQQAQWIVTLKGTSFFKSVTGRCIEAISKIGFWLKVKAGPSVNPPRKHHGISDRHT